MPSRKRAAKPIEIALTEEQIEGIIAEAAARTRRPSSPAAASPPAWTGAGALPPPSTGEGEAAYPAIAGAGWPGDGLFQGYAPADAAAAGPEGGGADPVADPPSESEIREVEEHRRNVIRQLRGWEA